MSDGKVIISTELETKKFDAQIKETEEKLNLLEKSADESNIPEQFRRSAEETRELNAQIEKTRNKLVNLQKQKKETEESNINIKNILNEVNSGLTSAVKKVGKWALAVFSVRSAYSAISNSVSILSQYDNQLATNIEYIQFALANVLKPVIEKLLSLVIKILQYVNYLAKAWFNVNIFSNATANAFDNARKSTKQIKKDTKEIAKNLADGLDEITNLDDISASQNNDIDDTITSPNFDLSTNLQDVEIPKWLKWLAKNGDKVKKVLLGIGGAIATIKIVKTLGELGELSGILKGIATIGTIAIGVSLLYTALTGRNIIEDLTEIKNGLEDIEEINNRQQSAAEKHKQDAVDLIDKFQELDSTVGLTNEQLEKYVNWLFESIDSGNELINGLEEQKNWLGEITGENDKLSESQRNYSDTITIQLEAMKKLYEQGQLNEEQKEKYKSLLENQIESLTKENQDLNKNSEEYKKNKTAVSELKKQLENITGKEYKIKTSLEKPKTNIFKQTINGLLEGAESIVNSVGGLFTKSGKLNVKLPRLASGGIVNNPGKGVMMNSYIAGERGAEAILPLENSKFIDGFANDIASKLGNDNNTQLLIELNRNITDLANRPIELNINGKKFAQATYSDYKEESKRHQESATIVRR